MEETLKTPTKTSPQPTQTPTPQPPLLIHPERYGSFVEETLKTTAGWPPFIVNDREQPLRAYETKFLGAIDDVRAAASSCLRSLALRTTRPRPPNPPFPP